MPFLKRRAIGFLILTVFAIFVLAAALIVLMTRPARASTSPDTGLPAGITCEMVREKVAEHGKAVALAWALRQGYSFAQIRVAKRCLRQIGRATKAAASTVVVHSLQGTTEITQGQRG